MNEFQEYLREKKIDPLKFKSEDTLQYEEFSRLFDKMNPKSFTSQKLFLINKIRSKYLLEDVVKKEDTTVVIKQKPKIGPRIKT